MESLYRKTLNLISVGTDSKEQKAPVLGGFGFILCDATHQRVVVPAGK